MTYVLFIMQTLSHAKEALFGTGISLVKELLQWSLLYQIHLGGMD